MQRGEHDRVDEFVDLHGGQWWLAQQRPIGDERRRDPWQQLTGGLAMQFTAGTIDHGAPARRAGLTECGDEPFGRFGGLGSGEP
ncbi:hypothetical protein NCC78_02115 [Micromonospora phytophila]|nr:hypothetical protein [Micromonospora phytophila]MCM0673522.1 hypothetical protein [Micromonospora phytophila]